MGRMRSRWGLVALLAAAVAIGGCAPADDDGGAETTGTTEATVPGGVEVTTPPESTPSVEATEGAEGTVLQLTLGEERLNRFAETARRVGLFQALQGLGPYTVFAPTDEAFDEMGEERLNELLERENRDELARIVTYHVVPGRWSMEELQAADSLPTLSGRFIEVQAQGGEVSVDGVTVGEKARETTAGIVYLVDEVLQPENGSDTPSGQGTTE